MSENILFEDIFTLNAIDRGGRKFDKVSRIEAHSEQFDMDLVLDVNVEIYPLTQQGSKFTLVLASTLSLDGTPDDGVYDQSGGKSLMDKFEYVMYGKVFKYLEDEGKGGLKVEAYASFGGLLMRLSGDGSNLKELNVDQRIYLLIRKVT